MLTQDKSVILHVLVENLKYIELPLERYETS